MSYERKNTYSGFVSPNTTVLVEVERRARCSGDHRRPSLIRGTLCDISGAHARGAHLQNVSMHERGKRESQTYFQNELTFSNEKKRGRGTKKSYVARTCTSTAPLPRGDEEEGATVMRSSEFEPHSSSPFASRRTAVRRRSSE